MIESFRALDTLDPDYTILGNDLTVKLYAHVNAKESHLNIPKYHNDTLSDTLENALYKQILMLLEKNSKLTQEEISLQTSFSIATIKCAMKQLTDDGRIIREGGKRYGFWKVNQLKESE
ncbi:MAG: winged helix-turn-helix domain-containing protein [Christensenellales bacterium]|jgi:ATP-dependent DNA helicase RecG